MPAPVAKPPRRRRWLAPAAIAVTIVLIGTGVAAFAWFGRDLPVVNSLPVVGHSDLYLAHDKCAAGELSDGDHTLFLDTTGRESGSGRYSVADLACVLNALQAPTYVVRAMEQTRALDGRQTETWEDFSASWTYHPDNGLDVLIREK